MRTEREYKLKIKLEADTKAVKLLKEELTKLDRETATINNRIGELYDLKKLSKRGMFDEDIKLSKELDHDLKILINDYNKINALKQGAKRGEKSGYNTQLKNKELEIERLLSREIRNQKTALSSANIAIREKARAERELAAESKITTNAINKENQALINQNRIDSRKPHISKSSRQGKIDDYSKAIPIIQSIRRMETLIIGAFTFKTIWDKTLGIGHEFNVEMQDIETKLKGIIASSSENRILLNGMAKDITEKEKWDFAGKIGKELKRGLKQVTIDTSSSLRDTGRIMSAILPQALGAGATMKEVTELTKGFTIAMSTGALTIKEAVTGLDNVISGDSQRGELINYLKTIGISMKELKNAKGHEAIEILLEKLKVLNPIIADLKKNWKGIMAAFVNDYEMLMGDLEKPFMDDAQKLLKKSSKWIKAHRDEAIITSKILYDNSKDFLIKTLDVVDYFSKGIFHSIKIATVTFKYGYEILHLFGKKILDVSLFGYNLGDAFNFMTEKGEGGLSIIQRLIGGFVGLRVINGVSLMVLGFGKTILRLSGLTWVFSLLMAGFKGISWSSKKAGKDVESGLIKGTNKGVSKSIQLLNKLKTALSSFIGIGAGISGLVAGGAIAGGLALSNSSMQKARDLSGKVEDLQSVKEAEERLKALNEAKKAFNEGDRTSKFRSIKEFEIIERRTDEKLQRLKAKESKITKDLKKELDGLGAKGLKEDVISITKTFVKDIKGLAKDEINPFSIDVEKYKKYAVEYKKEQEGLKDEITEAFKNATLVHKKPANDKDDKDKKDAIKKETEHLKHIQRLKEEFDNDYIRSIKGQKALELKNLDELRNKRIEANFDPQKVDEWYNAEKTRINKNYEHKDKLAKSRATKTLSLNKKNHDRELYELDQFNSAYNRATTTNREYEYSQLAIQKDAYLRKKIDLLRVDEWYNAEKIKLDEKFQQKDSQDRKEFLNLTGDRAGVFEIDVKDTLLKFDKLGYKGKDLSKIYDKMWKDFKAGGARSLKGIEKLFEDLKRIAESAFSSLTSSFAKSGKIDITSFVTTIKDGAISGLKNSIDPIMKGIGYGADIAQGLYTSLLSKEIKLNTNDSESKTLISLFSQLNEMVEPHLETTRQMASYLSKIELNFNRFGVVAGRDSNKNLVGGNVFEGSKGDYLDTSSFLKSFTSMATLGLFGSKKSYKLKAAGLKHTEQSLTEFMENIDIESYQVVEKTTKRLFGALSSKKDSYNTQEVDGKVKKILQDSMIDLVDMIQMGAGGIGEHINTDDIQIDLKEIRLDGKSGVEISEYLSKIYGEFGDKIVAENIKGIDGFKRADEGELQTLTRVSADFEKAKYLLKEHGISLIALNDIRKKNVKDLEQEVIKESLIATEHDKNINLYIDSLKGSSESVLKEYLNIKDFMSTYNEIGGTLGFSKEAITYLNSYGDLQKGQSVYYEKFFTEEENRSLKIKKLDDELKKVGIILPSTTEGFKELVDSYKNTDLSKYGKLMGISGEAYELLSKQVESMTDAQRELITTQLESLEAQKSLVEKTRDILFSANDISKEFKRNYSLDILKAELKYGTAESSLNAGSRFLSQNSEWGYGEKANLNQQYYTNLLSARYGDSADVVEVSSSTLEKQNIILIEEIAKMNRKIEELKKINDSGKDMYGNTPVVIVGDNR